MENASKALIIAGAILVSISIIVLGVALISGAGIFQDQAQSSTDTLAIQAFNAQFESYEGTITASKAKQLIKLVETSNVTNEEHKVEFASGSITAVIGISSSKKYDVSFEKNLGFISTIKIEEHTTSNGGSGEGT